MDVPFLVALQALFENMGNSQHCPKWTDGAQVQGVEPSSLQFPDIECWSTSHVFVSNC